MSALLDAAHSSTAHSNTPLRKRSRQDSACDTESSPGSSHGNGSIGSNVNGGSVENDDNEDDRQAGSQKRARSEGPGESDYPDSSISWTRGHPLPLPSVETTRHLASRLTSESASEDSLIPLPVTSRSEVRREPEGSSHNGQDSSSSGNLVYTAREDLARSMEFDQQMDVLRHTPRPVSLSPSLASQSASTVDVTNDMEIALEEREQSIFLGEPSLSSAASHEASEPQTQIRGEVSNSSGRLHALGDTTSRMSRPLGRSTGSPPPQSLDTAIAPGTSISPSSHDSSLPMPSSRLRLLRRTEHLLPRMLHPPPPALPNQHRHSAAMPSRSASQVIEDTTPLHIETATSLPSTTVPPSSRVTDQPQASEVSQRLHPIRGHRSTRIAWLQNIHDDLDPFEPFSPNQQQDSPSSFYSSPPILERSDELRRPTLNPLMARQRSVRLVDRHSSHVTTTTQPPIRPSRGHFTLEYDDRETLIDRSSGAPNRPESDIVPSGGLQGGNPQSQYLWTTTPGHELVAQRTDSSTEHRATDPFDDDRRRHPSPGDSVHRDVGQSRADPELDGTPIQNLRSTPFVTSYNAVLMERDVPSPSRSHADDFGGEETSNRSNIRDISSGYFSRPQTDLGHDGAPRRADSTRGLFRDDTRGRLSFWDSESHSSGLMSHENLPSTASFSPLGRSSSRSLLDPALRFGLAPATSSRTSWSSGSEWHPDAQLDPSRRGFRRTSAMWNMGEDSDSLDLDRHSSRYQRRRVGGPVPSSYFSSMDEDITTPIPSSSHRTEGSNSSSLSDELWATRILPSRDTVSRPPFRATSASTGLNSSARAAEGPRPSRSWHSRSRGSDSLDIWPRQWVDAFPSRPDARPGPNITSPSHPDSTFGFNEQARTLSRLQRYLGEAPSAAADTDQLSESMEDMIPESNARGGNVSSALFGGDVSADPLSSNTQSPHGMVSPPRPMEPRLSPLDVGPRPNVRFSHRQFRPPSLSPSASLARHDDDALDALHATPTVSRHAQRRAPGINQPLLGRHGWHHGSVLDNNFAAERHMPSDERPGDGSRTSNSISLLDDALVQRRRDLSLLTHSPRSRTGALIRGTSETFNELVRRRAARADTLAWATRTRRSPSPDRVLRSAYRVPRPSSLFEATDIARRRDRVATIERRHNVPPTELSSTLESSATSGSPLINRGRELVGQERHNVSLLGRSVAPRNIPNDSSSRTLGNLTRIPTDRDRFTSFGPHQRNRQQDDISTTSQPMMSEPQRHNFLPLPDLGQPFSGYSESEDNNREREQLHDVISRHSRDDEDARRALSRLGRSNLSSRDPWSEETARNLERRLRESEVDMSRALRALDQWGELEGSSEPDADPTQSRMHRFGETMRRRRVPPAFNFSTTTTDNDSFSGAGSSGTARQRRRSPSPSAVARLQSRQARFARAQGRFRELSGESAGESRARGTFASRLDLFGGSRLSSRLLSRSLGDYMRDEDFDASYENLVRLAAVIGDAKPRGTPAHLLASMPTGFYKEFAVPGCETRCPICLDDYKDLDPVLRISDCDHWFHKECLQQWLQNARSCPLCKGVVRGRTKGQKLPPDDTPGPSGSRRDSDNDDEGPSGRPNGESGRIPALTLEELGYYAGSTAGW